MLVNPLTSSLINLLNSRVKGISNSVDGPDNLISISLPTGGPFCNSSTKTFIPAILSVSFRISAITSYPFLRSFRSTNSKKILAIVSSALPPPFPIPPIRPV